MVDGFAGSGGWRLGSVLTLLALAGCGSDPVRVDAERAASAPTPAPVSRPQAQAPVDPLAGVDHLDWPTLRQAVLAGDPRLAAVRASIGVAETRRAQVTAFDDPMLEYELAPRSVGTGMTGQAATLSQATPWFGKRAARGAAADAETAAARAEVGTAVRRELVAARLAMVDAWLAGRRLELLARSRPLIAALQASALAAAGAGGDAGASLEAAMAGNELERDILTAGRDRLAAAAALNALLGRPPGAPLPTIFDLPPSPVFPQVDPAQLPEVAVAEARVRQAEADLDVAQRDRHPDPTWKLGYSSMMEERDNRVTVGVAFALPVQRGRREAMVDEAAARIAARRHEHAAALAEAARELAVAAFDRDNDRRALELVETQQVPTARRLAETARAGLAAGTVPLATALRAERAVIATQLQAAELRAALARAEAPLAELPAADASDIPMGTPP